MNEDINREEIKKNPLVIFEERPDWVRPDDWKNRHRISAKLVQINYTAAFIFFTRMGWAWSSGINHLIASNPDIKKIQKELQKNA